MHYVQHIQLSLVMQTLCTLCQFWYSRFYMRFLSTKVLCDNCVSLEYYHRTDHWLSVWGYLNTGKINLENAWSQVIYTLDQFAPFITILWQNHATIPLLINKWNNAKSPRERNQPILKKFVTNAFSPILEAKMWKPKNIRLIFFSSCNSFRLSPKRDSSTVLVHFVVIYHTTGLLFFGFCAQPQ